MAALAVALGAVAAWTLKRTPVAPGPLDARFEIVLPKGSNFSSNYNRIVTISPDSRFIAYTRPGMSGLQIRPLNDTSITSVPDSQQARSPAFSSDSRQIAYWESGVIKRASVDGGTPIVVSQLGERPMGMQWAEDGYIYVGRADEGIWRAPGSGGELEPVLSMDAGEYAHGPELLPGGEWILFTLCRSVRGWSNASIVAQSLTDGERRVLVPRGRDARYVKSGHLAYVDGGTLFAVPFDIDAMRGRRKRRGHGNQPAHVGRRRDRSRRLRRVRRWHSGVSPRRPDTAQQARRGCSCRTGTATRGPFRSTFGPSDTPRSHPTIGGLPRTSATTTGPTSGCSTSIVVRCNA